MKGGYQIIDLLENDITSASSIDGLYEALEGNHRKPVLLTHINVSDVEKSDIYVMPEVSGSSYVLRNVYGYDITVNSDDTISVASTQWATRTYADQAAAAKTVYCHPVSVRSASGQSNKYRLSFLLFNTSDAELTIDTFKDFIDNLAASTDYVAKLTASGAYFDSVQNITIIVSYVAKLNDNSYYVVGLDASTGDAASVSSATFNDIFDAASAFTDGVNAIN